MARKLVSLLLTLFRIYLRKAKLGPSGDLAGAVGERDLESLSFVLA